MKYIIKFLSIIITIVFIMVIFSSCVSHTTVEGEIVFGTNLTLNLDGKSSKSISNEILDTFSQMENDFSATIKDSYIDKINQSKAGEKTKISKEVFELIELSQIWYEKTNGLFNPAIYPITLLWGLDSEHILETKSTIPTIQSISEKLYYSNMDAFVLDKENLTISKKYDDAKIELGGIAKGYAIDKSANLSSCLDSYLINIGGEIAIGQKSKTIGIQSPFSKNVEPLYKMTVSDSKVATSGTYEKYFTYNGNNYNHIISTDGYPSNTDVVSVTVVGASATICDILATVGILSNFTDFETLLSENNYSAFIIYKDKTTKTIGNISVIEC